MEKTMNLAVVMTDDERATKARLLAETMAKIDAIRVQAKDSADRFKRDEKLLDLDAHVLAENVRSGKEYREVDVFQRENLPLRTWEIIRGDTGEIVESRPMTPAEINEARQGKLEIVETIEPKRKKAAT